MRDFDTIVLGTGISGCYAATLLAEQSKQVALISPNLQTKYHLPESWVFSPSKQLQSLDILDDFTSSFLPVSHCSFLSQDGKKCIEMSVHQTSHCPSYGDVVRVDRNLFDRVFFKKAQSSGVEFIEVDQLTGCAILDTHVEIHYKKSEFSRTLTANNVIDGSGKNSYLASQLSLRKTEKILDSRHACFSHFEGINFDIKSLQITALDQGYLFCIPINSTRLSVGCVLAKSYFDSPPNFEQMLHTAIDKTFHVKKLLKNSNRVLPVIPIKNSQVVCEQSGGSRYRIVGDAAVFMDPFFCPGIDFAIASVEQAIFSLTSEDGPETYQDFIKHWLKQNQKSIYSKINSTQWGSIIRTFADPHLPYVIPLMLTQAFCQIAAPSVSFEGGIDLARKAYE